MNDNTSFCDRKSTTSSMCTMCGNPDCKGLNGNDSMSVSSLCDRPCVYIGEGKNSYVSSLVLNVMGDNTDTSINSSTSQFESNNNNESTNFKKWHSGSQKSSGTIPKPPKSKASLRYSRKPKEQVITLFQTWITSLRKINYVSYSIYFQSNSFVILGILDPRKTWIEKFSFQTQSKKSSR